MAKIKLEASGKQGVDTSSLDITLLGDYDRTSLLTGSAKFFDDSKNYALFSGTGFKYVKSGEFLQDITGGTVTKFELAIGGVKQFTFTDIKFSAAKLFDFYVASDVQGALDYVFGGNDTITGTAYADVIFGGGGNDTLNGGSGNDKLRGNTGDDKLYGGAGADKLHGGSGADTFVFKSIKDSTVASTGRDLIQDFHRGQGDKISLKAIDANTKVDGDQKFAFIGTDKFSGKAGELRFEKAHGDTFVYGDVDGNGKADFSIAIDLLINLKATDFIL